MIEAESLTIQMDVSLKNAPKKRWLPPVRIFQTTSFVAVCQAWQIASEVEVLTPGIRVESLYKVCQGLVGSSKLR
jgi:hypothetical protein